MITGLVIKGYRCFKEFEISGLGRVTLLVGKNNSGKTSLLEAVELVAARGNEPYSMPWLLESLDRRGEFLPEAEINRERGLEYEACNLFHDHQLKLGSWFEIEAQQADDGPRSVRCEVKLAPENQSGQKILGIGISSKFPAGSEELFSRLSRHGGVSYISDARNFRQVDEPDKVRVEFVSSTSLGQGAMQEHWGYVVLNPEEELAVQAVRILDPEVERLAIVNTPGNRSLVRGGMAVKLRRYERRVPIGSLGEGVWRMLAIALSLVRARNGTLLVDDIDTGLHHAVMGDMWRMVFDAAQQLNVQVIATTQSLDCVAGLAKICGEGTVGQVSLQRIEPGNDKAVAYTEKQIKVAAERNVEVR